MGRLSELDGIERQAVAVAPGSGSGLRPGVGYVPPATTMIAWRWSLWGDLRDAGPKPPYRVLINLGTPYRGSGDLVGLLNRYGGGATGYIASRNGAQIINGGLEGEAGGAATSAAFDELRRRFRVGELGSPSEWDGWPTAQEQADLVVAEWGEGNRDLPPWQSADPTTTTPAVTDLSVRDGFLWWKWPGIGTKRPTFFVAVDGGRPETFAGPAVDGWYGFPSPMPERWREVAVTADVKNLEPSRVTVLRNPDAGAGPGAQGPVPVPQPEPQPQPQPQQPAPTTGARTLSPVPQRLEELRVIAEGLIAAGNGYLSAGLSSALYWPWSNAAWPWTRQLLGPALEMWRALKSKLESRP